jgi:hypothetical protein
MDIFKYLTPKQKEQANKLIDKIDEIVEELENAEWCSMST